MTSIALIAVLLGATLPVNAFMTDPRCRWPHSAGSNLYLDYRWGSEIDYPSQGTPWRDAFRYAAGDWTATATPLFVREGGADFTFDTYYALDGTYGWMELMIYQSGTCLEMYPSGNRAYFRSLYEAEHTAGHEIGHGLPLDHSEQNVALMWSAYNAAGVPQYDDINGVNYMYP